MFEQVFICLLCLGGNLCLREKARRRASVGLTSDNLTPEKRGEYLVLKHGWLTHACVLSFIHQVSLEPMLGADTCRDLARQADELLPSQDSELS